MTGSTVAGHYRADQIHFIFHHISQVNTAAITIAACISRNLTMIKGKFSVIIVRLIHINSAVIIAGMVIPHLHILKMHRPARILFRNTEAAHIFGTVSADLAVIHFNPAIYPKAACIVIA